MFVDMNGQVLEISRKCLLNATIDCGLPTILHLMLEYVVKHTRVT